jgi:hypothetical protein
MAKARTLDLGSLTANEVAAALGVRVTVVYEKFKGKTKCGRPNHDWALINPESCAICSDGQLAKMIGCHKQMVVRKRLDMGIYRDSPRVEKNAGKAMVHVGRWCKFRGGTVK